MERFSEFPQHAQALRKFGQIQDTVFILDGDQRGSEIETRIQEAAGRAVNVPILFLPGSVSPESWMWDRLKDICPNVLIDQLGIERSVLIPFLIDKVSLCICRFILNC